MGEGVVGGNTITIEGLAELSLEQATHAHQNGLSSLIS
jgi:hypothetical protein